MKRLNVTVQCMAIYNSSVLVPDSMNREEAIEYAKNHIDEISVNELEYVSDSDILDEENCDFIEEFNGEDDNEDDKIETHTEREYWTEINGIKTKTTPAEIIQEINNTLVAANIKYDTITFIDWTMMSPNVRISLDGEDFGIFDYYTNTLYNQRKS